MTDIEFRGWPKIARLNRDIIITEKIDGTNAAVGITEACCTESEISHDGAYSFGHSYAPGEVYAQSRTRIITPEKDNFGFAAWVRDHADALRDALGPGLHFGEWWGKGIQRGYGLSHKRFSLFHTKLEPREGDLLALSAYQVELYAVPVLYEGPFSQAAIETVLAMLRDAGSAAAPGYMKPEGIVIYHTAAKTMFKVTLEHDEKPKGSQE